ncbi:MAG: FecR domain-containing protein [Chromatiales bacterium]|nr:FecR domain-containing protein [Chromatiales bacterium]
MKTLLLVALLLLACQAAAEIGTVKNVSGEVQVEREGRMLPVEPGFELSQDDAVITGKDGRVGIIFIDNSRFSAGPNSRLELARFRFNPTTHEGDFVTRVRRGTVAVVSGQIAKHTEDAMKIETPQSNLGVRGTKFLIQVQE